MGPIWGRQDPGEPHVGPMNFAIWDGPWGFQWNFSKIIESLLMIDDCKIALRWMSLDFTDDKSTLAQVMAWYSDGTGHYQLPGGIISLISKHKVHHYNSGIKEKKYQKCFKHQEILCNNFLLVLCNDINRSYYGFENTLQSTHQFHFASSYSFQQVDTHSICKNLCCRHWENAAKLTRVDRNWKFQWWWCY